MYHTAAVVQESESEETFFNTDEHGPEGGARSAGKGTTRKAAIIGVGLIAVLAGAAIVMGGVIGGDSSGNLVTSQGKIVGLSSDSNCHCVGLAGMTGTYDVGSDYGTVPSDFGTRCEAWDQMHNTLCTEGDEAPAYCSLKWCYVDQCNCDLFPKKSTALPTAKFQGRSLRWSYAACGGDDNNTEEEITDLNETITEECATEPAEEYGNAECLCRGYSGVDGTINFTGADGTYSYPGDVGSKCDAWDKDANPACEGDSPPDYCEEKWCFVDPCTCNITAIGGANPQKSGIGGTFASTGMDIYYSYATCGGTNNYAASTAPLPELKCAAPGLWHQGSGVAMLLVVLALTA